MTIKSPLTNSTNIKLERSIKTALIIDKWQKDGIDVSRFFVNLDEIKLYRCLEYDYKFYYPFNLEGDNQFYQDLQKFSWYYMDWKWEYEQALRQVLPGDKVLEIGCGQGDFIKKLKDNNINAIGLEFNDQAIEKCRAKGLIVAKQTIEEHASGNQAVYDVVCSFQVMEHIADIGNALTASLGVLKRGGKLIISVPNNDSFLGKDKFNLMNLPPHHMGLWDEKSLKNLEKFFNIKLEKIYLEPLQTYHYRLYYGIIFAEKIRKVFGPLAKPINKILGRISLYLMVHTDLPQKIKGHTIMAVYIKS